MNVIICEMTWTVVRWETGGTVSSTGGTVSSTGGTVSSTGGTVSSPTRALSLTASSGRSPRLSSSPHSV